MGPWGFAFIFALGLALAAPSPARADFRCALLLQSELALFEGETQGWTDLHRAAAEGQLAAARAAVSEGARDARGRTALHIAAVDGTLESLRRPWLKVRSERSWERLLVMASNLGKPRIPLTPAQQREAQEWRAWNDFMRARVQELKVGTQERRVGRLQVLDFLIAQGADVNARDAQGRTPLHDAAQAGELEVVRRLLRAGARVDATTVDEATPLHDAQSPEIARVLLEHGADPTRTDRLVQTPLHRAALRTHYPLVEFYLTQTLHRIDFSVRDASRMTAIDLVREGVLLGRPVDSAAFPILGHLIRPEGVDGGWDN